MEFTKYYYHPEFIDQEDLDAKEKEVSPHFLSLSNSWSRKTINNVFSGEAKLLDILKTKSNFCLPDESGLPLTEIDLPDCLESFDIFLEGWINRKIILHIDFLLSHRLKKKES